MILAQNVSPKWFPLCLKAIKKVLLLSKSLEVVILVMTKRFFKGTKISEDQETFAQIVRLAKSLRINCSE